MTRLRDVQRAEKILLLGVSVSVLSEEISIYISGLSKEDCPRAPPIWVGINQSFKGLTRTKRQRKSKFSLSDLGYPIFSCLWTLALLVLGPVYSDQDLTALASLVLRPSDLH